MNFSDVYGSKWRDLNTCLRDFHENTLNDPSVNNGEKRELIMLDAQHEYIFEGFQVLVATGIYHNSRSTALVEQGL